MGRLIDGRSGWLDSRVVWVRCGVTTTSTLSVQRLRGSETRRFTEELGGIDFGLLRAAARWLFSDAWVRLETDATFMGGGSSWRLDG